MAPPGHGQALGNCISTNVGRAAEMRETERDRATFRAGERFVQSEYHSQNLKNPCPRCAPGTRCLGLGFLLLLLWREHLERAGEQLGAPHAVEAAADSEEADIQHEAPRGEGLRERRPLRVDEVEADG